MTAGQLSLGITAVLALWGASVVGEDMRSRKIPNAKIIFGLELAGAGLLAHLALTAAGLAGYASSYMNPVFYAQLALNAAWVAAAGLALWYGGVWPAGDAKFYMALGAALPLAAPLVPGFPHLLFMVVLVNTFVAASFWAVGSFLANGLAKSSPSEFFSEIRGAVASRLALLADPLNRWAAVGYLVGLPVLFMLQQLAALEARGVVSAYFARTELLFFFLFVLWEKIGRLFRSRAWLWVCAGLYAVYLAAGLLLYPDRLAAMALSAVKSVLQFSLLAFTGRELLRFLLERRDRLTVTAAELSPGDILSERFLREARENPVHEGLFEDYFKDGLSAEQVEALRAWLARLPVRDPRVEIIRGRPFALWIFAGAMLASVLPWNLGGLLR